MLPYTQIRVRGGACALPIITAESLRQVFLTVAKFGCRDVVKRSAPLDVPFYQFHRILAIGSRCLYTIAS